MHRPKWPIDHTATHKMHTCRRPAYGVFMTTDAGRTWGALTAVIAKAIEEQRCAYATNGTQRQQFHRLVASGILAKPYLNLYAPYDYWQQLSLCERHMHIMRALTLRHPKWIFAGMSALEAYGFEHSRYMHESAITVRSAWANCIGHPRSYKPRQSHHASTSGYISDSPLVQRSRQPLRYLYIPDDEFTVVQGMPVTSPVRTIIDAMNVSLFPHRLAIADSALAYGLSIDEIVDECDKLRMDCNAILTAFEYADQRSENGGESFMRAVLIQCGFQIPQIQVEFADPRRHGSVIRVDALISCADGRRIVIEFDGLQKYHDPDMSSRKSFEERITAQASRDRALFDIGISTIVHCYFEDLVQPERFIQKLVDARVPRPYYSRNV